MSVRKEDRSTDAAPQVYFAVVKLPGRNVTKIFPSSMDARAYVHRHKGCSIERCVLQLFVGTVRRYRITFIDRIENRTVIKAIGAPKQYDPVRDPTKEPLEQGPFGGYSTIPDSGTDANTNTGIFTASNWGRYMEKSVLKRQRQGQNRRKVKT